MLVYSTCHFWWMRRFLHRVDVAQVVQHLNEHVVETQHLLLGPVLTAQHRADCSACLPFASQMSAGSHDHAHVTYNM